MSNARNETHPTPEIIEDNTTLQYINDRLQSDEESENRIEAYNFLEARRRSLRPKRGWKEPIGYNNHFFELSNQLKTINGNN